MSAPTQKRAYAPPLTEVWFCQPRSIICTSGNNSVEDLIDVPGTWNEDRFDPFGITGINLPL